MYDTPFHGIALKRSGIAKMADLQGKSIGVGPRGGTPGTYFPLIMNALGIRVSAVRYGSGSDMAGQVQDGLLDAFLFASGIPIPAFSEIATQADVNFLDYTEEEVKKLTQAFPEMSPTTIPAGTYGGKQPQPLTVVGMYNFAIAHKSLPEDFVYEVVKSVLGQNQRMVQAVAAAKETVTENAAKNSFLPYHPGAAKYLREQGVRIPDNLVAA
jgi:TRAP transporter TAXI family solute receptor